MVNNFIYREMGNLVFYQTPLLENTGLVCHAFTTRKAGVSSAPFANLNLALHTGDDREKVKENRKIISSVLGVEPNNWVAGKQVHGSQVRVVTEQEKGRGALDYGSALEDTDALITNIPGLVLTSYHADCVSILILDPNKKAIGVAHAGWRGTVDKIGIKTLQKMQEVYGSQLQDFLIAIGPSIGPCCFEVDEKVLLPWKENFPYWQEITKPVGSNKWLIDLWETNKREFLELGVIEKNIAVTDLCTSCRTDLFFSYRAEKGRTGRMAALIALKN